MFVIVQYEDIAFSIRISYVDFSNSGYGDSSSTLVGQVSSEDIPYVCIADLPDNPGVRTEFLFPSLIGQFMLPLISRTFTRYFMR